MWFDTKKICQDIFIGVPTKVPALPYVIAYVNKSVFIRNQILLELGEQEKRIDFPAVIVITKYYQFFKHITMYVQRQKASVFKIAILQVLEVL